MSEVRIFVTYYKNKTNVPFIKSDVFQPIMAGSIGMPENDTDGFIRDDSGDNISKLNSRYGELTVHYWILKNYLPNAKEKYLGVCHYRRFLGFKGEIDLNLGRENEVSTFKFVYFKYFIDHVVNQYTEQSILSAINNYDVVGTQKWNFINKNNRALFDFWHRAGDMDLAIRALERINPDFLNYANDFFNDNKGYYCLCLVMKKELLEDYFDFEFKLLEEMAKEPAFKKWESYEDYNDIRMPAFIMERMYNIWLRYMIDKHKIKILELPCYKLIASYEGKPEKRVEFIKSLSQSKNLIDPGYFDGLSARHPILNKFIKLLVKKDDFYKLLGNPRGFFFDSRSFWIRLLWAFYK